MRPTDNIAKLIKELKTKASCQLDQRVHEDITKALAQSQTQSAKHEPNIWRIKMNSKIIKLAVAAVIIIAVMIGLNYSGLPIDGASVAWADLAEYVEQIQTCVVRQHSTITGDPKGDITVEGKMCISSEYGTCMETYMNGKLSMIMYMLPVKKEIISVIPEAKKYMRITLTEDHLKKMAQQGQGDPREMIKQIMSVEYTELGRDVIDGIEVEGIETTDPSYGGSMFEGLKARLWVDVETNLPVRMEMEMQMPNFAGTDSQANQMLMVMDGFEWDVELDASIFKPDIPDDYSLLAEVEMSGQDEESAIEGFSLFAEISGGKYPSKLNPLEIMTEVMGVSQEDFIKERVQADPNSRPSEEEMEKMVKEVMEKAMTVQGTCMFYAELVKENKDVAYYGDTITADDIDAVLLRWKIADDKYRVIFGDLTAEDVTSEQLADLEADQLAELEGNITE